MFLFVNWICCTSFKFGLLIDTMIDVMMTGNYNCTHSNFAFQLYSNHWINAPTFTDIIYLNVGFGIHQTSDQIKFVITTRLIKTACHYYVSLLWNNFRLNRLIDLTFFTTYNLIFTDVKSVKGKLLTISWSVTCKLKLPLHKSLSYIFP